MATKTQNTSGTEVEDQKAADKNADGSVEQPALTTTEAKAEEKDALPTGPEKVEEDESDLVFTPDSEFSDEDFEDGDLDAADGVVYEKSLDGDEYEAPYVYVTGADLNLGRTSDSDDPAKSWTAQETTGEREDEDGNAIVNAVVPVDAVPGQTFRVSELPSRAVMEANGVNYDQWIAGLPVRSDVPDEAPRRGIPA